MTNVQEHALLLEYGIASPRGTGALLERLAGALEDGDNEMTVSMPIENSPEVPK